MRQEISILIKELEELLVLKIFEDKLGFIDF